MNYRPADRRSIPFVAAAFLATATLSLSSAFAAPPGLGEPFASPRARQLSGEALAEEWSQLSNDPPRLLIRVWAFDPGGQCNIGVTVAVTNVAGLPANAWWVIAGTNGSQVSSFGKDSSLVEEPFTGWAAYCPAQTSQNTTGTCP